MVLTNFDDTWELIHEKPRKLTPNMHNKLQCSSWSNLIKVTAQGILVQIQHPRKYMGTYT